MSACVCGCGGAKTGGVVGGAGQAAGWAKALLVAAGIALALIVIVRYAREYGPAHSAGGASGAEFGVPAPAGAYGDSHSMGIMDPNTGVRAWPAAGAPDRRSVYAATSRLYSTADVDPLVTGQMYAHADGIRNVYAERTSHGNLYGLAEYSSSGAPGDTGVDVGPYGLEEYGGKETGYDDGIPPEWTLPSTPVRWYAPKQRDHYGQHGATPYSQGSYSLTEGDHDPLLN